MQALAYWKAVTADRSEFLDRLVALLGESSVRYCVLGDQAVNGVYRTRGGVRARDNRTSPTSRDSWRPTPSCDASFRRPCLRA